MPSADVSAPPDPTLDKQATPLCNVPCIDFPSAPHVRTTASTPPSSSSLSSVFIFTNLLEERLHALHRTGQIHRLAALRNLDGVPVHEA